LARRARLRKTDPSGTQGPWTVRRHRSNAGSLKGRFDPPLDHVRTVLDVYENGRIRHAERPFLGRKREDATFEWMTYGQGARVRDDLASGLRHIGIEPGSKLGLYGVDCPEWVLLDAAWCETSPDLAEVAGGAPCSPRRG